MIVTRAQKIRLGVFVTVAVGALLAMFAVLVGEKLTRQEDAYFARFSETVSGLEIGAQVKYHGVRIGTVTAIEIDRDDVSQVLVSLSLKRGTPVKKDSRVVLNSMGITGLKFVELTGGTNESDFLEPGSEIESENSLLDRLSGKADVITEKVELLVNNLISLTDDSNRAKIAAILDEAQGLLASGRELLDKNREKLDQTLEDLSQSATNLNRISTQLAKTLDRTDSQLEAILDDTAGAIGEVRELVQDVNGGVVTLLTDADELVLAASDIVASPSLKRVPKQVKEAIDSVNELVKRADRQVGRLLSGLTSASDRIEALLSDARVEQMLDSLARLSVGMEELVKTLDLTLRQSREDLFKTLSNLKDVVRNLNDFTQMLLENPSILLRGSQLKERKP